MKYKGWVVRMKKRMIESARKDIGISDYINGDKKTEAENFYAYGDFDYLQFVPISSWNEYHENFLMSDWVGQRQAVMLFQIKEPVTDEEIASYILKDEENFRKGRFHILTMLHLSNEMKDMNMEFEQILRNIKKAIFDFIALYPSNGKDILKYDVYGTFSSSEIAIIWSVSQYEDVIDILDYLRYLYYEDKEGKRRVFIASYTIVAWNKNYEEGLEEVRGNALVQVEFSSTANIAYGETCENKDANIFSVKKNIKEELEIPSDFVGEVISSVGKTDFIIQIPAQNLQKKPKEGGMIGTKAMTLMHGNENVEWVKKVQQNINKLKVDIQCSESCSRDLDSKLEKHWETYKSIFEKISHYGIYSQFQELLLLMFSDYKRVISSSVDQKWLADYEEQFETILNIINTDVDTILEKIKEMEVGNKQYNLDVMQKLLKRCTDIIGMMQQQVNHIFESSKLFFTSPNSDIGYTAQFDLMLHMYYGIIKSLIANAYHEERNSWQYPLVPIVAFMNESKIESTMAYASDHSLERSRLIRFQFPCDAWANPLFYLPYLVHEVYHYIAPYNRVHRNESFLVIALAEMGTKYFAEMSSIAEKEDDSCNYKKCATELRSPMKYYLYSHIAQEADEILLQIEKKSSYRDKTYQSEPGCLSDMPIYQLQEAFYIWIKEEWNNYNPKFCAWLQAAISEFQNENCDGKLSFDISPEQLECLKRLEKKIGQEKEEKDFSLMKESWIKIVRNLFHYLREIYPDCAMMQHLGMGISEYLVQMAIQLSNKLIMPSKLTGKIASEWIRMGALRIAPIIEYFCEEDELEEHKSSFCTLYANTLRTIQVTIPDSKDIVDSEESVDYGALAEDWFGFFRRCHNEYKEEYSIYGPELRSQASNYQKCIKPIRELQDIYEEYWKVVHGEEGEIDSDSVKEKLIDLSLKLVLKMQKQDSIAEMNQKINRPENRKNIPFVAENAREIQMKPECKDQVLYTLQNGFSSLMGTLNNMVNALDDYHNEIFGYRLGHEDLWYRGMSDEKYHIFPSLYREYAQKKHNVKYDEKTKSINISLEQVQHHLLQRFQYQADGAPEIINQAVYQSNDYLALMQHYQLPTNLLDWSEDVFASIYFALEKYFKEEDSNEGKKDEKKKKNPAVYLLDPEAYNRARQKMIKEICGGCLKAESCKAYKRQQVLMEEYRELVPNISAQVNEEVMNEYFCKEYINKKKEGFIHKKWGKEGLGQHYGEEYCEFCKLPVAYYSSRLSPRIRAQSGQFLAFSLDVSPRWKEDKEYEDGGEGNPSADERGLSFDYMALDEIQKYYLDKKGVKRHPFMLKLVIPEKDCKRIAMLLRLFGIKTIKYYPELTNLKN